jgi:hypothetical protein
MESIQQAEQPKKGWRLKQDRRLDRIYEANPKICIGQWHEYSRRLSFKLMLDTRRYTSELSLIHYYHTDIIEDNQLASYIVYFTAALDGRQVLNSPLDIYSTKFVCVTINDATIQEIECHGDKCRLSGPTVWCASCYNFMDKMGAECIQRLINSTEEVRPNMIPKELVLHVERKSRLLSFSTDMKIVEQTYNQHLVRIKELEESSREGGECDRMIKYYHEKKLTDALKLDQFNKQPPTYFKILEEMKRQKQEAEALLVAKEVEKQHLIERKKELEQEMKQLSDKINGI